MPFTPYSQVAGDSKGTAKDFTPYSEVANSKPHAPASLSASQYILNAITGVQNLSQGAAKGSIKGLTESLGGMQELGGSIESTLDKITGTKNDPLTEGAKEGASISEEAAQDPRLQGTNKTQKAGEVIGQAADLAIPADAGAGDLIGDIASKSGQATEAAAKTGGDIAGKVKDMLGAAKAPKVDPVESALAPRLTPKVAEKEGASDPKGLLGTIQRTISDSTKKVADTVRELVPDFDKKKTFTEKANAVSDANEKEAENLKSKVAENNHPYTYKELNSTLKNLEKPELIKTGDATVQRLYDSARSKMLSLARKNGGDTSGLLQARKDFYTWVNKEYKNLWGSDNITAAREGIGAISREVNTFISDQLPEDSGFKQSLEHQSNLFDAEDVLREKAARGNPTKVGEIGSNAIDRFEKDHPFITSVAKTAAGTIAGGEALKQLGVIP